MKNSYNYHGKMGFSLMELLCVASIISILVVFSGLALVGLSGAGAVNKAIFDVASSYELARSYAMANSTYVRVALSDPITPGVGSQPVTVVMTIYSADGSLTVDPDMSESKNWPLLSKPLILKNLCYYSNLNAAMPDTQSDSAPSQLGGIGSATPLKRRVPYLASMGSVTFPYIVQFNPSGEARVVEAELARYIKVPMDQPQSPTALQTAQNKNPFLLRISGSNGTVNIIRKDAMSN